MLNDTIQVKKVYDQVTNDSDADNVVSEGKLSKQQWSRLSILRDILKKFDRATRKASSKRPNMSQSIPIYFNLRDYLCEAEEIYEGRSPASIKNPILNKCDIEILRGLHRAKAKFDKYFDRAVNSNTLIIAAMIDPRRRRKGVETLFPNNSTKIDDVIEYLKNKYECDDSIQSQLSQNSDFDEGYGMQTSSKSDFDRYLEDPCVVYKPGEDFDILQWWKNHRDIYPTFAKIARDYLSVMASSVSVERLFNFGRDILSIRRYSLSTIMLKKLMTMYKTKLDAEEKEDEANKGIQEQSQRSQNV
ncbi:hypothetical protein AKO1_001255 [Acrasis kona]|uniref:HAT C-terminal dimerisation domain-containing protein n=1 Tax=Acrasis kona TaxID=1008807 RepID=A0AAW2ZE97_9EUKA